MPEEYIPEAQSNPPNNLSLLDIIKAYSNTTGQEFSTRFTNLNDLLSGSVEPLFENIQGSPYTNEELGAILTELTKQTLVNNREILFLRHLVALISFELIEQGIKVQNKELLENLKQYLKYK